MFYFSYLCVCVSVCECVWERERDVRVSFKYFVKEGDKEWWRLFFENYDEIGIYLFELNFIGIIFLLILIIFIINYDDISYFCCLSIYL